ncbi:MAG: hypothetical protein VKJ64_21550 [Leptolyngbyaceae bacterium]|nr:hypothetical protein [Leptolyngbyaceae bacterium]
MSDKLQEKFHNLPLPYQTFIRLIRAWLLLSDDVTQQRLGENDRGKVKGYIEEMSHTHIALQQCEQLGIVERSAWPAPLQHLITAAVGIFGALVVGSSAMGLVSATGRGPIAAAGGAIAGGASAVLTDIYATRYLMRRRMRYNVLQTLAQLRAECNELEQPTVFQRYQYQCQKELVQQVEAQYWAEEPKSEKAMAIAAITAEGIIALIVSFPAGIPLALASAAIPIVINLLVAKVQSDRFEIPEACGELIPGYEVHIPGDTIPALDALLLVRLDACLQYVANPRPPRHIRSVEQAQGLTQAHFAQERVADFEDLGVKAIAGRKQHFQAELESLPDRCPEPDVDVQGLSKPQADQLKKQWIENWIAMETQKLEAALHNDLELLHAQFGQAIATWKTIEAQGLDEYRRGEPSQDVTEAA